MSDRKACSEYLLDNKHSTQAEINEMTDKELSELVDFLIVNRVY